MPYSTKSDVKSRLIIKEEDLQYDDELDSCIEQADAWIDRHFIQVGKTVPSPVPADIKHISADRAAGYFKQRREPEEEPNRFLKQAESDLEDYLTATYKKGKLSG